MAKTNIDKKNDRYKDDIAKEALAIVTGERSRYEDATCYVTEKVAFRMREMIRAFRKNYWGIFDQPIDPATGREKTWIPLAMRVVEDYVKNINMGQKDINFRANNPKGYSYTHMTRAIVRDYLDKMVFGEIMDEMDRQLCIDGTVVWKTWESKDGKGNVKMSRSTVDLLNIYIDPTEQDIQSAYRFTERGLLLPDQVKGMTGWYDTKGDIKGSQALNKNDSNLGGSSFNLTTGEFLDVWETWGKIPRWLTTGDKKAADASDEIDGHIVVSGLDSSGKRVHLIEENRKTDSLGNVIKPYEECRDAKIAGRWYGLGKVERILALVMWLNTTNNIRIGRAFVAQLGLFKIRKGSGITPSMIAKLPVNGAIEVTDIDSDIAQMPVQEVGPSSYKDEEIIKDWATAITSAYPISAGGDVPASQTATTSAIQNSNAKTGFSLTKEAKGFFLTRWMDRHALPIIAKTVKKEDLIRYAGDEEALREVIDRAVASEANETLSEDYYAKGIIPTEQEVVAAMDDASEKLLKKGDLFIELMDDMVAEHVDTHIYFNNEDLDTAVTVQNLMQMLAIPVTPQNEGQVAQIYDLLGLDKPKSIKAAQPSGQAQGVPTEMQGMTGLPGQVTSAMTQPQLNG
jgi:hypothetical protein